MDFFRIFRRSGSNHAAVSVSADLIYLIFVVNFDLYVAPQLVIAFTFGLNANPEAQV